MKCRKCAGEFEPRPWQVKKYDFECPACKRTRQNAFNHNDPHFREKHRVHYQNQKKWYQAYRKRQQLNPIERFKQSARRRLRYAIETGKLAAPLRCVQCGKPGKVHAHHNDYTKPLSVLWVCYVCHSSLAHRT